MTGLKIRSQARTVDEVIVAADVGTARTRTRRGLVLPTNHRRRVTWLDQSSINPGDADALTMMRQAADQALTEGAPTQSAVFTLREVDGARFGVDWRLGDIVTCASWQRATVTAPVLSVRISHQGNQPRPEITASIGDTNPDLPVIPAADVRRVLDGFLRAR